MLCIVAGCRVILLRPAATTARRLVEASVSPNTRRAYASALRRLDVWLDGRELHDVTLAAYLAELHDAGRASSSASMAVAAACFRTRLAGRPSPAGERTARVLAGYRRTASDRGRGQARPFGLSDLAAVLATCHRPRRRGRGVESDQVALERGRLDAVIAGLLFMAGMRRSEVSALRWADVADSTDEAVPGVVESRCTEHLSILAIEKCDPTIPVAGTSSTSTARPRAALFLLDITNPTNDLVETLASWGHPLSSGKYSRMDGILSRTKRITATAKQLVAKVVGDI